MNRTKRERLQPPAPLREMLARADVVLRRGSKDFKRQAQFTVLLELRRYIAGLRTAPPEPDCGKAPPPREEPQSMTPEELDREIETIAIEMGL